MKMVKVITQETYDDVVNENIKEFDMAPDEAVKEAVAQFEAQGVDLSNIIKDLALSPHDDHLVSITVKKLKNLCIQDYTDEELIGQLNLLMVECNKDIAHRVRAGKEGAYIELIKLLEKNYECYAKGNTDKEKLVHKVLSALISLMEMQPDLLDINGINLMKRIRDEALNEDILLLTLKWINICCLKHEGNRQKIFNTGIISSLRKLLKKTENLSVLNETLLLVRRMTLDDDIRVEFGKAPERARELGVHLIQPLTDFLIDNAAPECVGEVMVTISAVLVRNELCASAARCCPSLFSILADHYDSLTVTQHAVKLIIALAGNDVVKRDLVKSGIVPIIVTLLRRYSMNAKATALILKCIAVLCLREPDHSKQFLENGAAEAIVQCLKIHQDVANVQKNGCWAIRNLVARYRDHNAKFHELGVQAILNKSYDMFADEFGFDIKSALRDLECEVRLEEQWTGRGVHTEQ